MVGRGADREGRPPGRGRAARARHPTRRRTRRSAARNAANIVGISRSTSRARPRRGRRAAAPAACRRRAVMPPMIANAVGSARRRRTVADAEADQVADVGDGARARRGTRPGEAYAVRGRRASRGEPGRHGPPPPPPSRRSRRSRRATRRAGRVTSVQAWIASSRRWVETRMQAPRARASAMTSMVASTPIGSTPSKGSSSSSRRGSCSAASTTLSRRPMPWLKPPVIRCATSPSSKRSRRSRARSSQSSSRRSRAESWRCSHGVARGTRPPTSGQ